MVRLWLIIVCSLKPVSSVLLTVLQTPDDLSQFEANSGAVLANSSLFGHTDVTICARFLTYQFIDQKYQNVLVLKNLYLLYSEWNTNDVIGSTWTDYSHPFPVWDMRVWNHFCIMMSSKSRTMMSVLNGHIHIVDTDYGVDHSKIADNLTVMGSLIPNGFEGSFFGRVTDINIWSRVFNEEQAKKWTS